MIHINDMIVQVELELYRYRKQFPLLIKQGVISKGVAKDRYNRMLGVLTLIKDIRKVLPDYQFDPNDSYYQKYLKLGEYPDHALA